MKKIKRLGTLSALASLLVLLSGCVRVKDGKPYGMVYDYLAKPMQHLMEFIAQHMGGSYGWSIVVIVIIVRLILLPSMMSQMKKSTKTGQNPGRTSRDWPRNDGLLPG